MHARHPLFALVVTAAALVACEADEGTGAADAPVVLGADLDLPLPTGGARPAWETEAEKQNAKADSFDARGSYQDIYGITQAPSQVRALAEFERKDGVLIAWEGDLSPFFADLVAAIAPASPVYIVTPDVGYSRAVADYLADAGIRGQISYFEFPHESFWARDYGPIAVALGDGSPAFVDQKYYPDRRRDDAIPTLLGRYFDVPVFRPDLASEGGNFMSNGEGLCVSTSWLLEENYGQSRTAIERIMDTYYGCSRMVILERIEGEGTGHVDMFAKFVGRDTVLVGTYDRYTDPANAAIVDRNAERLASLRLADGTPLRVVRIPMPAGTYPVYRSYTNSLIINDTVVVPVYRSDRTFESQALAVYRQAMPGYRVVPVESDDVIQMGGAVHCTTMGFGRSDASPADDFEFDAPAEEPAEEPAASDTFSSDPGAPIRDGERASDTIEVSGGGSVDSVVVAVDIDHTYIGDLRVVLSHGGREIELHRFAGGGASGLQQSWEVSGFAGLPASGSWTLTVEDHYQGDVGTLKSWSLSFR